jgi:RNA polymerase sigma-70 factor (ECF subfamily)
LLKYSATFYRQYKPSAARKIFYRRIFTWIIDQYRREPIPPVELTEEQHDENANPEEDVDRHLRRERLQLAVRKLTPDQQQVIMLKYLEGWQNEEIAHSIKKPVGAVKSLQSRALASLQKILNREDFL